MVYSDFPVCQNACPEAERYHGETIGKKEKLNKGRELLFTAASICVVT